MTPHADAPMRVWAIRQVPPPGSTSDLPDRRKPFYQATVYKRTPRRYDGLSVWRVDTPLGTKQATILAAEAEGRAQAGTIPYLGVSAFDLACRLDEVVPVPGYRAMVRLGEGWRFVMLVQPTSGSRGTKYLAALCQHDLPKAPVDSLRDYLTVCNIKLIQRIGRFNEGQIRELLDFTESYGFHTLGAISMPTKPGNTVNTKYLRAKPI